MSYNLKDLHIKQKKLCNSKFEDKRIKETLIQTLSYLSNITNP